MPVPVTLASWLRRLGPMLSFTCLACGSDDLTRPADLEILDYPANQAFTLTLVMRHCRSTCATYGPSSCEVSVDADERRIRVDPEVPVETDSDGPCAERCGGAAVLAHCRVEPLAAGTWTVDASEGNFSRTITLR